MKSNISSRLFFTLLTLVLVITVSACGPSTIQQLASAVPPTEAVEQEAEVEQTVEETTEVEVADTPVPTEVPPTPMPEAEDILLVAQGFGQDEREVGVAFVVENPNTSYAINSSQYQIAVYDASDVVVETSSGYIELLLPGEKLGIGDSIYVDEGVTVAKVVIQLNAGEAEPAETTTTFTVDKIAYYPGDWFDQVIGVITNPYQKTITDLRVSAVLYNAAGEIIGSGFTYTNFILAESSAGVEFTVAGAGEVDRVEIYPALSGLSTLDFGNEKPVGAQDLVLVDYGYGQGDYEVGFGMILQNPNSGYAVENSMYHITLYAEDGGVIGEEGGYIDTLLPNQTLGVGNSLYLVQDGFTVANVEVQILSGNYEASEEIPTFTTENVTYIDNEYFPSVTGEVVSPYATDISNLRVSAIVYDEAGKIIGGGFTFLDFVPANGKAAVEVNITCVGTPARVELYATLSALSDIE